MGAEVRCESVVIVKMLMVARQSGAAKGADMVEPGIPCQGMGSKVWPV